MWKHRADQLKQEYSTDHQYQAATEFFDDQELNRHLDLLTTIGDTLEQAICDYALDFTHDLLDPETPQIVRVYWFSKGLNDYYLCIDGSGLVRDVDEEMPSRLFRQIKVVLDTVYS